jgi:hypothetical protein
MATIECTVPTADGGVGLLISETMLTRLLCVPIQSAKQTTQREVTPPLTVARASYYAFGYGVVPCPEVVSQRDDTASLARAWSVCETPRWCYSPTAHTFNPSRHENPHQLLQSCKVDSARARRRLRGACLSLDAASIRVLLHAGVSWGPWGSPPAGSPAAWWAPTELLCRNPSVRLGSPLQVRQEWDKALDCPVPTAWRARMTEALNVFLEYAADQTKSAGTASSSSSPSVSQPNPPWPALHVRVRVLRDAMLAGETVRLLREISNHDVCNAPLGRMIAKHCAALELSTWKWHAAPALRTALWAYHTGRFEAVGPLLALVSSSDAIDATHMVPHSELQWLWLPVSTAPRSASNDSKSAPSPAIDWALVRSLLRACIASKRLVKIPECLSFLASDAGCMDILIGESPHAFRLLRGSTSSFAPSISPAVSSAARAAHDRRCLSDSLSSLFSPNSAHLIIQYCSVLS